MKNKIHYYAWAINNQGASIKVTYSTSIQACEIDARQFCYMRGPGWTVHIMRVDADKMGGYLGATEVKTFTIR